MSELTKNQFRIAVEQVKKRLGEALPHDAVWFIGTSQGCVMVCKEGTFFVDSNGDVIGPADPTLVEAALNL